MTAAAPERVTLFLAGDVMTGRGVDQILPHRSKPELRESYIKDAVSYVELAEDVHGPVPAPVDPSYVWGDALQVLEQRKPQASIVNLETSITTSDEFWPRKAVHYRMHPGNVACLQAAHIDVCTLANNHLLDFDRSGLLETIDVLRSAGIQTAGAGADLEEASRPARVDVGGGAAVLVFALGSISSGIPLAWAAGRSRPGVHLLADLSRKTADQVGEQVRAHKGPDDIAVASIHWGSNWGHEIPAAQVAFAHRLVERGVDVVHGHSSHHVRSVEIYEGKPILYGCGDLVTDYEGIGGHEAWRGDVGAMYFATHWCRGGDLASLRLVPMHMRRLQLRRAPSADAAWVRDTLNRLGRASGSSFELDAEGALAWRGSHRPSAGTLP